MFRNFFFQSLTNRLGTFLFPFPVTKNFQTPEQHQVQGYLLWLENHEFSSFCSHNGTVAIRATGQAGFDEFRVLIKPSERKKGLESVAHTFDVSIIEAIEEVTEDTCCFPLFVSFTVHSLFLNKLGEKLRMLKREQPEKEGKDVFSVFLG